jgi:antitoxin HicB
MHTIEYPFVIYPAVEGGYVAEIPALKGCLAQGETLSETLSELEIVSQIWVDSAKKQGKKLPQIDIEVERVKHLLAA